MRSSPFPSSLVTLLLVALFATTSGAQTIDPAAPASSVQPQVVEPDYVASLRASAEALRFQNREASQGLNVKSSLKPGSQGAAVAALAQALIERGFLPPMVDEQGQAMAYTDYSPLVEAAVRQAQASYGLVEDGVAGPQLMGTLATSDQDLANALDLWRTDVEDAIAQARSQGQARLIVVNVASYTLHALDLENGQTLESRVIIGMPSRATPLMTTNILNLKVNPDWSPTPSMRAHGKVYHAAGPNNPLGLLRFSTDNHQNIYLHDTNERKLFERSQRALSSGCVRVQDWTGLAAFVAGESTTWVDQQIEGGRTRFVPVPKTPVLIAYSLVDVLGAGQPTVHPDVYGLGDRAVGASALRTSSSPAP